MTRHADIDLTFLAARLHGRRSRVAEGGKLDELCGLQSVQELSLRVLAGIEFAAPQDLQKELTRRLILEVVELRDSTRGPLRELLDWELVRFAASNLKVILRGVLHRVDRDEILGHLVDAPGLEPSVDPRLASSKSLAELVDNVRPQSLREPLARVIRSRVAQDHPFFFEAALDGAWLEGMLQRASKLAREDSELVRDLVVQETRIFHLVLVFRGRAQQKLDPAELSALRVELGAAERRRFASAIADPRIMLTSAAGGAAEGSVAESAAWSRFLHLANRAFRRSPMGEGVVAGYTAIRRVELANLITVSEGIRAHVPAPQLRSRLLSAGGDHA